MLSEFFLIFGVIVVVRETKDLLLLVASSLTGLLNHPPTMLVGLLTKKGLKLLGFASILELLGVSGSSFRIFTIGWKVFLNESAALGFLV